MKNENEVFLADNLPASLSPLAVIHEKPWTICYSPFRGPDDRFHICDLDKAHEERHYCQAHEVREAR